MEATRKQALKRWGLALLAFAVGWLTMPLWPFLWAALVWNDCVDEEAEEEGGAE